MILDNTIDTVEEYRDYLTNIDETIKNFFDSIASGIKGLKK